MNSTTDSSNNPIPIAHVQIMVMQNRAERSARVFQYLSARAYRYGNSLRHAVYHEYAAAELSFIEVCQSVVNMKTTAYTRYDYADGRIADKAHMVPIAAHQTVNLEFRNRYVAPAKPQGA